MRLCKMCRVGMEKEGLHSAALSRVQTSSMRGAFCHKNRAKWLPPQRGEAFPAPRESRCEKDK